MKKLALFLSVLLIAVTLAAPASAAVNFTPSVEQKPAPTVDTVTDSNGNEVSAIIRDQNGEEVHGVSIDSGELIVTPISQASQAALAYLRQGSSCRRRPCSGSRHCRRPLYPNFAPNP